jgi:PKD repeat protein
VWVRLLCCALGAAAGVLSLTCLLPNAAVPRVGGVSAGTPSPTPGPWTSTPFPLHFVTLPRSVFVGQPLRLQVEARFSTAVSFDWSFGDGSSETGVTVSHVYAEPGTYTIVVDASTAAGLTATVQTTVTVNARPAPAQFTIAPGEQQQTGFSHECPPPVYVGDQGNVPNAFPNPYLIPSCGCCGPSLATFINDGAVALQLSNDAAAQTLRISAPPGWEVVVPDLVECGPISVDQPESVICPTFQFHLPGNTVHIGAVPAGTYPTSVSYPAGWNLVAGGDGAARAGLVYGLFGGSYQRVQPGYGSDGPSGYWAYFPHSVTLALPPRGPQGASIHVTSADMWMLVGNPGQTPVTVEGADAVAAYDSVAGAYVAVTSLQPGQAAWVLARDDALVTLTPAPPAPLP